MILLISLVTLAWVWNQRNALILQRELRQAELLLSSNQPDDAQRLVENVLARSPNNSAGLLLAAKIAVRQRRYHAAVDYYRRIPDDVGFAVVERHALAGDVLFYYLLDAPAAEAEFRTALRLDSDNIIANSGLANLLTMQGRRWEAAPHLVALVRQQACNPDQLLLLAGATVDLTIPSAEQESAELPLEETRIRDADRALTAHQFELAVALLREELSAHPHRVEAYARLGEALLAWHTRNVLPPERTTDDNAVDMPLRTASADLIRWIEVVPDGAELHPLVWSVRGDLAVTQGQPRSAARCYWESVRLDPDNLHANYRLSHVLTNLSELEAATPFRQRAAKLNELAGVSQAIIAEPKNIAHMLRAAEVCDALERLLEARAWYFVVLATDARHLQARREFQRLNSALNNDASRIAVSKTPATVVDLSDLPLPGHRAI